MRDVRLLQELEVVDSVGLLDRPGQGVYFLAPLEG